MQPFLRALTCPGAVSAWGAFMKTYLCLITVREGEVPQLRHLDCPHEDDIPVFLAPALSEWARVHRVEVLDGERLVFQIEP